MSKLYEGRLLIADITGYTMYLSQSELDHAQDIISTLLEIIVKSIHPPLVISRLAGDAVISYGLREQAVQGQTFIEIIENIYVAFQKAIQKMVLNNNCQCNACRNISTLDLKFFVHFGTFGKQSIGDNEELVGSDVNLIHRLLKNHVHEKTGLSAYTLYTDAALHSIGEDELKQSMIPITESYEHLGEINAYVQDMRPVWERERKKAHISIPQESVLSKQEITIDLPVEITWDFLIQPRYRSILMGSDRQEVIHLDQGRINPGSVYHCYHGDRIIRQTVLEWQPFERMVTEDAVPLPKTTILVEYRLEPVPDGTCFSMTYSKARGPWLERKLCDMIMPGKIKQSESDLRSFKEQIEKEQRENTALTSG